MPPRVLASGPLGQNPAGAISISYVYLHVAVQLKNVLGQARFVIFLEHIRIPLANNQFSLGSLECRNILPRTVGSILHILRTVVTSCFQGDEMYSSDK